MSIELILEIDESISREELIEALLSGEACEFSEEKSGFNCFFENSGLVGYIQESTKNYWKSKDFGEKVISENLPFSINWKVVFRIIFRFPRDGNDGGNFQIKNIINFLDKNTKAKFLLSFQFEKIYAIKNGDELKIFSGFD